MIDQAAPAPKVRLIRFEAGRAELTDQQVVDLNDLAIRPERDQVTWVDVQGFGNQTTINEIAEIFQIHPLAMEDIINVPQRPQSQRYDDQTLVITRMVSLDSEQSVQLEQVSLLIGEGYVVTFQERYGDVFDSVRKRIADPESRIRSQGSDFLAYAIIDAIVDGYYPVIDALGDGLEELESNVLEDPSPALLVKLNVAKNMLVNLRRSVGPQREAVNHLIRGEFPLISDDVKLYLRDTYDHCVQTLEVIEMYREMAIGLLSIYLSAVANRSNDVMKVLTIMASIFIPLTFIAGIYGMNFEHMPELHLPWAYPAIWGHDIHCFGDALVFLAQGLDLENVVST